MLPSAARDFTPMVATTCEDVARPVDPDRSATPLPRSGTIDMQSCKE